MYNNFTAQILYIILLEIYSHFSQILFENKNKIQTQKNVFESLLPSNLNVFSQNRTCHLPAFQTVTFLQGKQPVKGSYFKLYLFSVSD